MREIIKNITGLRMIVLQCALVVTAFLAAYIVTYLISGKTEFAFASASAFAFAFAAFAAASALVFAAAAAEEFNIRWWKCLIVVLAEAALVFFAILFCAPYLVIGVLIFSCAVIIFLLAESKLQLKRSSLPPV